jgi:ATP adenylyltransferase
VTGEKPEEGCVFCNAQQRSSDAAAESLIVHEGRRAFVILNLYPYNNGHVMIVPRRHVSTLASLDMEELQEIAVLAQRCETALTRAYRPQGINVGINIGKPAGAGILDHIHVHAVPRWNGDTNFMTVIGESRVLPESLGDTAKRLRPIFEELNRRN